MARLNLVIADVDEFYVESIVNFLMINYAQRFQVNSFSKLEYLLTFLNESEKKIDILLVSPDLYSPLIPREKIKVLALLSDGRLIEQIENYSLVSKYQHGDKLVSNLLNIFSEKNQNEVFVTDGKKQTRVIGIYSPVGGSGTSTISVGCSIQCAARGFSSFYLNLETLPSTRLYFKGENTANLSNIFYYIKEKNKNLLMRIEGTRCIDDEYKVHYFLPSDSALEMEEMKPEELQQLIQQLRLMNQYDVVFVDISSTFNKQNIAVLEACDQIILVLANDTISSIKAQHMVREFDILLQKNNLNLMEKIIIALNKYSDIPTEAANITIGGKSVAVKLPASPALITPQAMNYLIDTDSGFGSCINQLLNIALQGVNGDLQNL